MKTIIASVLLAACAQTKTEFPNVVSVKIVHAPKQFIHLPIPVERNPIADAVYHVYVQKPNGDVDLIYGMTDAKPFQNTLDVNIPIPESYKTGDYKFLGIGFVTQNYHQFIPLNITISVDSSADMQDHFTPEEREFILEQTGKK